MKKLTTILSILFAMAIVFTFANVSSVSAQDFNILLNPRDCLDLENTSGNTNVRIKVTPCDAASTTQRFQVVSKPGTAFVNIKANNGLCIEIKAGQFTDGEDVTQFSCDSSSEQAFRLASGTAPTSSSLPITGQITFSHSGKCFDARNSPWVQQFPCDFGSTSRQTFQIKQAPTISPNSQFLAKWSAIVAAKLPVTIGQVELKDTTSFCSTGCDCLELDENESTLFVNGWTPSLSAGPNRDAAAKGIKPALLPDYCSSGAVARGINLEVQIWDKNMGNSFASSFDYTITPKDCSTGPTTAILLPLSPDDQMWSSIASSKNVTDFRNYLIRFGQSGNHAAAANKKIVELTSPVTPVSPDDLLWNSIASSKNVTDFRNYLSRFGQSGKHSAKANLKIVELTAPPPPTSPDDKMWNSIASSKNVMDFRNYLSRFGQSGKHASDANLRIVQLTSPTTTISPDDQMWNSIASSSDPKDFRNYLSRFGQSGKHSADANLKIVRLTSGGGGGSPTLSAEDKMWNSIEKSIEVKDFRNYLTTFGTRGKHAVDANRRITEITLEDGAWDLIKNSSNPVDFRNHLARFGPSGKYAPIARLKAGSTTPTTGPTTTTGGGTKTIEDRYWDRIENSKNPSDFRLYLRDFPNGKYAPLARLEIVRLGGGNSSGGGTITTGPGPVISPDEKEWKRIENSNDSKDFRNYVNTFPRGKHKRDATFKIIKIEQEKATVDFLRNAQFGSLGELGNKRKVFITASDFNSRSRIVNELRKKAQSLVYVSNPGSADFFIEYKLTISSACDPGTSTANNACELHTGQLWLHTKGLVGTGNEFNRILWTTTKTKSYSDAGVNFFDKNPAAQAGKDLAEELQNMGF